MQAISPKFAEMSSDYPDMVFLKVDVDEVPDAAAEADIASMPTFHVYKDSKKVGEIVGAVPGKLKALVETHYAEAIKAAAEVKGKEAALASSGNGAGATASDALEGKGADSASRIVALEVEVADLKTRLAVLEKIVTGKRANDAEENDETHKKAKH
ncbi:hypothetical protein BC830DRAFT_1091963 [Chytriomyces sp. MP71]|nr:hypothetical protein BC830DRAFT_1091963 [Chytriomyces sp. MP71]